MTKEESIKNPSRFKQDGFFYFMDSVYYLFISKEPSVIGKVAADVSEFKLPEKVPLRRALVFLVTFLVNGAVP